MGNGFSDTGKGRWIYELGALPVDRMGEAGGKAGSLAHMIQNTKLRIPKGYVILSDAFEDGKLKGAAGRELADLLLRLSGKVTYAVRSSALGEDGQEASFAGQYETVTDVKKEEIREAVSQVAASLGNANARAYTGQRTREGGWKAGIAIVIQEFIRASYAGVLFTADPITGRDENMVGNYVAGEGEKLVSGAENAKVFTLPVIRGSYEGPDAFAPYAKTLGKYGRIIRRLYGIPMDIEWAVSKGRVYILQARPITTLRRLNMDTYDINGSRSGCKLLTRTNVGEIFLKSVSPMTFSVLEKINEILGLPEWLDNICGQPYMNISVMCSMAVAFGSKKEKAYETFKSLTGNAPEGIEVPISPFDKKAFLKKIWRLFFPKVRSKLNKKQKKEMVRDLDRIAREMIGQIRKIESRQELLSYWDEAMMPKLRDGMASVIGQSGSSMLPLFNTRGKIAKVAGEAMAERLCSGCLGGLESMKPLLLLEDVKSGKITKQEYLDACGQRSPNEMELMEPRPYEDPSYVDELLARSTASPVDIRGMQKTQRLAFEEALSEFQRLYPGKRRWIEHILEKFIQANTFREELRSKGVWIFCVFREYLLAAGARGGIGDDIFMLTFDELFPYLAGEEDCLAFVEARRNTYAGYLKNEPFPGIVLGRFDEKAYLADPERRSDVWLQDGKPAEDPDAQIKGFAGAAGVVRGTVRVIKDVSRIGEIREGDILVTCATNIGWTPVFSKVSAIVTDIGAPLSHAAIVARECGIPAVVGCGNATTLLHTGDTVIVDGAAGTVKKEEHGPRS